MFKNDIKNENNVPIKCSKCEKTYSNDQIFQFHLKFHEHDEQSSQNKGSQESSHQINEKNESLNTSLSQINPKGTCLVKPSKNRVGLTKIRLEDCLRCDECSCIYMDHNDYIKHMKNFHKEGRKKRSGRIKRGCRSCCKQCKCMGDCDLTLSLFNSNSFQFNIKNRWSKMMVSQESPNFNVKMPAIKSEKIETTIDDEDKYAALLASVEVRIKTEPPDE